MNEDSGERPPRPELPKYLLKPLEKQSPERLETVAAYAGELAAWKQQQRQETVQKRRSEVEIEDEEREALEDREVSTDPEDYEDVPASGAYITVKETKPGYRYYYWQWREGDSWKNEYIAPVSPSEE